MRALKEFFDDGARIRRIIREQRAGLTEVRSGTLVGTSILILGGGGREYAIAWRLARSDSVAAIDVIPGNPAMSVFARTLDIPLTRADRLEQHIAASSVDLVIVGPDDLV